VSDAEILAAIGAIARDHLGHDDEIALDTPLVQALHLDSIRMLTLVAEIENHFAIYLEEGDEAGIEYVGDLVAVIRRRREAS
jgi:acyl carrier protein